MVSDGPDPGHGVGLYGVVLYPAELCGTVPSTRQFPDLMIGVDWCAQVSGYHECAVLLVVSWMYGVNSCRHRGVQLVRPRCQIDRPRCAVIPDVIMSHESTSLSGAIVPSSQPDEFWTDAQLPRCGKV